MEINKIYQGDSLDVLKNLPSESINMCVTSPPYYGLRDYGVEGQIGLEETPEEYIGKLVNVFREVRRVLKNDGTLWVNIGDSYWGGRGKSGSVSSDHQKERIANKETITPIASNIGGKGIIRPTDGKHSSIKPKDLIGIPWMLAFALRDYGWYLRQDIIWSKPNPMPESVTDRCTKSHEYIFLLSKSPKYYFDHEAIQEPVTESTIKRVNQDVENQKGSTRVPGKTNGTMKACCSTPRYGGKKYTKIPDKFYRTKSGKAYTYRPMRNKRSVWTINTRAFNEAHFATFPQQLIMDCIIAGCPEDGVVLDPFMGSGTTAIVARKLNRNYIGIELNKEYIDIANKRIHKEIGLFNHNPATSH